MKDSESLTHWGATYATPKHGSKQLHRNCTWDLGVGLQEGPPGDVCW